MIGQTKLQYKLKAFTIRTLPKTILLVGDKGCGKHLLVKELGEYFNVGVMDISDSLNNELINEIYLCTLDMLYIIDTTKLTEKSQNMMLKVLEEPPSNAHFMLLSTNKNSIINTVLNRCMIYEFEPYAKQDLANFVKEDNPIALKYCSTPGQLINLNYKTLDDMESTVDKLIDKIGVVGIVNLLTISSKFNYGDEYDKYDLELFLSMLVDKVRDMFIANSYPYLLTMYTILEKYINLFKDDRLKKNLLMESLLSELWCEIHETREKKA